MSVIARDAVASDHLVYAWPFPIGPECEVACGQDEEVVMCPAWTVADRLGPGRHHWRSHSPMHPVAAFFVRTAPVECTFDLTTGFVIPTTGQPVRIRAAGSLQVRCADPGLLIAQFVGLPFDHVNDGILRSVSRSIERMLARLLTRRVVMTASPIAVTDPSMLPGIIEELVAYNPTAGAVFGIDLLQMAQLVIGADDGNAPYVMLPQLDWSGSHPHMQQPAFGQNGEHVPRSSQPDISLTETARGRPSPTMPGPVGGPPSTASGEIVPKKRAGTSPGEAISAGATGAASGEILVRPKEPVPAPPSATPAGTSPPGARPAAGAVVDAAPPASDITERGIRSPVSGPLRTTQQGHSSARNTGEQPPESRGALRESIMGIGMAPIGAGVIAGEIQKKVTTGGRVMFPGPNGLMQSATVRQLLQGYYELEVGSTGEIVWVPVTGVVPE